MAARLLEDDPDSALDHARAARAVPGAARLVAVREATGLAAYAAGRFDEALVELKAARRIGGASEYLPVIADCERGVGRPERALRMTADPDVARLDPAGRAELLIVTAGAHRDLGRLDAAIVTLRVPALHSPRREPWVARLRYAYADALLAAGDVDAARDWFEQSAAADADGDTDAGDRLAALDGYEFLDDAGPDLDPGEEPVPGPST
jgi:tetratricopeptide (TPR) repeat protein